MVLGQRSYRSVPSLLQKDLANLIAAFFIERARGRGQLAAALEQANDTKELNRVQRPLAPGGKLVRNSVDGFVTDGWGGARPSVCFAPTVDDTGSLRMPSTGYRQLFLH
jgi:hypothetical protein